jgi:predicted esterase
VALSFGGLITEGWGEPAKGASFVVLLNSGYHEDDPTASQAWFMRSPFTKVAGSTCFLCPYGPIRIERAPFSDLRWWPDGLDWVAGLSQARPLVVRFLDEITARYQPRRLFLGGYAQGAMLALDVALHDERPLDGLILWSAILPPESDWPERAKTRRGAQVVLTHSPNHNHFALEDAERLRDLLRQHECTVRWAAGSSVSDLARKLAAGLIIAPTSTNWLGDA